MCTVIYVCKVICATVTVTLPDALLVTTRQATAGCTSSVVALNILLSQSRKIITEVVCRRYVPAQHAQQTNTAVCNTQAALSVLGRTYTRQRTDSIVNCCMSRIGWKFTRWNNEQQNRHAEGGATVTIKISHGGLCRQQALQPRVSPLPAP